ncbi:MAG: hypothetical protein ACE5DI_02870 [Candidatus Micrarchaeia archaeon]
MVLNLAQAKKALSGSTPQKAVEKTLYRGPGAHATPNTLAVKDAGYKPNFFASDGVDKQEVSKKKPKEEERVTHPMFVPMDVQKGEGHDKKPVHVLDISSRRDILIGNENWTGSVSKDIYRNYVLMVACIALTLTTVLFNIWVAALFAYLSGHFHSERMVANAWEIEWWKGKSVVYTK